MSDLVADRMAELHRINDGGDPDATPPAPAVEPTPAAPSAPPQPAAAALAEPAAAPARVALSLDDPTPDDFLPDAIPPTLRKPTVRETIAALAEDRKSAIHRRDEDARVKNDYEARATVLENLLAMMIGNQQKQAPAPAPAEPAPRVETAEERIRREQLDVIVGADPALALGRTVDIARESIAPEIKGQIDPLAARVAAIEATERARVINSAYDQAGKMLKRDSAAWRSDSTITTVSRAVEALRLPPDDPQSYVRAESWLDELVSARVPQAAAPAPVATPAPTAPPPPVGSGAPAAPVETVKSSLSARDADMVSKVAKQFPNLKREQVEELALRTMNHRQRQAGAR